MTGLSLALAVVVAIIIAAYTTYLYVFAADQIERERALRAAVEGKLKTSQALNRGLNDAVRKLLSRNHELAAQFDPRPIQNDYSDACTCGVCETARTYNDAAQSQPN